MNDWLRPLRKALDSAATPVRFFFRDDDAGWDDTALGSLLGVFEAPGLPLDVAAIPTVMSAPTVTLLRDRIDSGRNDVSVHQHGFAHVNHEPEGRKCEFGLSRPADQQRGDIDYGKTLLASHFPEAVPVFTPPWNRCAPWTASVLLELGFEVLSRDLSAGLVGLDGLAELPVSVDWFAKVARIPVTPQGRGQLIANACAGEQPVGVMLHHAVMSVEDLKALGELLALVAEHPQTSADHLHRLAVPSATGTDPSA
jgi:hypothetical protein